MSLMHTNTFLRSSLISDPYTFNGDLDIEDVLRIQNQFPTLFESQNSPPREDHHHRTNEKISKIQTKKKFGEKPSNDSKIQNASTTTRTTTNLKDRAINDDKVLKKSTTTTMSISKDKIIHHYEMPVKCTRSRCTEKTRPISSIAVQPSKTSLFSGRKPPPSSQSQLSKIRQPKYRNRSTRPQDLPQSPYKEPLVDNYLKYVQRFYKKQSKSPSPSQNLQIVGQSNSKISVDGKRSVSNSNVQNVQNVQNVRSFEYANVKCKPKLKSSISLGQMDLNLRKSPDELVDEVLEKNEEFTSESQERFEQILLTKLLASKYDEFGQFEPQKCDGLMNITEVSEPDLSIISSMVEPQVSQHQDTQRPAEIDPKSVKFGEKFEQNRNIFKTNILQARCVVGKGFDEFDFFEEVSIIGEECSEIDPDSDAEISKILEKNSRNDEKSQVFKEKGPPSTSNKVHFRDFQDYISTSSTPKTSSSNEFSLNGQIDSIQDQFGPDDHDHDLSNIKNKLNDRMTKSSAEGVTEKMLVQIAKKLIKTEVEKYFKRSSPQIKFKFEDFENFDELKTPTGSTVSRPRGVSANLDLDDDFLNIKTPELTPPSRNGGKKSPLDKKVSATNNTMLKTPEKTPRCKDQLKTPGQDDPTDCSEISSFICSEVPSIPEKDKDHHGKESSEELITPKLTPTSEKRSRSKVKVKYSKNHTQSSIHPSKSTPKIPQSIMKSGKSSEKTLKNVQSLSPESRQDHDHDQGWMDSNYLTPSPQIKVNNEVIKSSHGEDFDCAKSNKISKSKKSPSSKSTGKSMKVFKKFSPIPGSPQDYESSKVIGEKENISTGVFDEDDDGTLKESIISELEESFVEKLSPIADQNQDQDQDGYSLYDLLSEGEYIGNKIKSPGEITPGNNDLINLSLKYLSTSNSFTDISTGDSYSTIQDERQFKNKDFINALSQGEFI